MKKILFALFTAIFSLNAGNATVPTWTVTINSSPDSAHIIPVECKPDISDNIYVLSAYYLPIGSSSVKNKIILNKIDPDGNIAWNFTFDNGGTGEPRGFDMVLDYAGNIFIAGALMGPSPHIPLIMKINANGTLAWQVNATINFPFGRYDQVFLQGDLLYLSSPGYGVAVFDTTGAERWSHAMNPIRMAVDYSGRMIVTSAVTVETVFRYDSTGVLDFSDTTIFGQRIAIDYNNNIILFNDYNHYQLVKYDFNGVFQWMKDSFPDPPPFGDIGFDVLTDDQNNIVIVGVNDTMYKYETDGTLMWKKLMNGLDTYRISAKHSLSDFIAIGGSVSNGIENDAKAALFNINGDESWSATYSSTSLQEYGVDIVLANDGGVYLLEDSSQNTTLIKFASQFSQDSVDLNLICVDNISYDTLNPNFVNISVFNGSAGFANYPIVSIVSPVGDSIAHGTLSFFGHVGNTHLVYNDSISVLGITDFSNYTILFQISFPDTTVVIPFCGTTGIESPDENDFSIYPNPSSDRLFIRRVEDSSELNLEVFNVSGQIILRKNISGQLSEINVESLSSGIYFLRLSSKNKLMNFRFVKN